MSEQDDKTIYMEEMREVGARKVLWELDMAAAMALVGTIQLALRHPSFKGPSADLARKHVMDFRDSIPEDFPGIKRVIEMGFHSKFDRR